MKKRYHFKLWKIKQTWSPLEEDLSLLLSWHAMLSSNSSFARALFEGPRMRTKDWSASCFRPRWINQYGDYRKATNIPKRQVYNVTSSIFTNLLGLPEGRRKILKIRETPEWSSTVLQSDRSGTWTQQIQIKSRTKSSSRWGLKKQN